MSAGVSLPGELIPAFLARIPLWIGAVGATIILTGFSWWLAPLLLAIWVWAAMLTRREYIRAVFAGWETSGARRASYYLDLALAPAAARELRIFGLSRWLIDRFAEAWTGSMVPVWRTRRRGTGAIVVTTVVLALAQALAYLWIGRSGVDHSLTLGEVVLYLGMTARIGVIGVTDSNDYRLSYSAAAVPAVRALEHLFPESRDPDPRPTPEARPLGSAPPQPLSPATAPDHHASPADIRFENVSFRYAGRDSDVLSDLNLTIPAGKSLAIVGLNGAGKTTLIKLLCHLYEPTGGSITAGGVDLRAIGAKEWQRRVAATFQDFVHYPFSARDNVRFGAIEASLDDTALIEAARQAGALPLIEELPNGWDTILSRAYGGVDLSGGQWQLIAIARALYAARAGARVLILDEPTAHLDARVEADLYDRFLEITAGLTTILISHRFSTVRRADRICVLAEGAVVEEGSHDELMARNGRYAEMFRLQALNFAEPESDPPLTVDGVRA